MFDQLDYESEVVALVGKPRRRVAKDGALACLLSYEVFSDTSIRVDQFTPPQQAVGESFGGTDTFDLKFVSADQLPTCGGVRSWRPSRAGGSWLKIATQPYAKARPFECVSLVASQR